MAVEGLCECGCGQARPRFIQGHDKRAFLGFVKEDRGYATPCHISTMKPKNGRYVQITVNGTRTGAHRLAYERVHGPIPDGLHIDHLCRVTNCINPAHMEAVTPTVNVRRQRQVRLTPDIVREIRGSDETGARIARRLDVSTSLISAVRLRKIWTDIE